MTGPLVTASALSRAYACPASVWLPQDPKPAGEAALKGTALHSVVEIGLRHGDPVFPPWSTRWPYTGVLRALHGIHPGEILTEIAYGFDGQRSHRLKGGQREYLGGDGMICGTADQVSYDGSRVIVSDLKCGRWQVDAHENAQLEALAVMAAGADRRRKIDRATVAIVQCPWDSTDPAAVRVDTAELDAIDLASGRARLRDLKDRIQAREEAPNPSRDACIWCAAVCPDRYED